MVLFPNAKINLGLYVVRKRSDGYHDLSTIMLPVPWTDILEIVDNGKNSVRLYTSGNEIDCEPEKNLVFKAISTLSEYIGHTFNIDVFLRKIIPDGAGLGGGSSDSSFILKGLKEIYSLNIPNDELRYIASKLGADCAFFIRNIPQLAEGIGDRLSPIDLPLKGWKILIVKPLEKISTAKAYASLLPAHPAVELTEAVRLPVEKWKNCIFNDFEPVAFNLFPNLKKIKEELYEAGAVYASMSGSGSAFYGLFPPLTDNVSALSNLFNDGRNTVYTGVIDF